MALIKYTSILNSFVSQEGSYGTYTNYVYYSVLVVYTDGTAEIVEGKKDVIAPLLSFLRTPVDELQDIKQLITNIPSDISNISQKIDENMSYVLDTLYPIPDVRGMKEKEAFKILEEYHLVPNITSNDGISDNKGTISSLQRSRLNYKCVDVGITHDVPAVDGLTKDVAIEVLKKAGFQTSIEYIPSLEQEDDIVLDYARIDGIIPVVELKVGIISKEEQKRLEDQRKKEKEQKRLEEQLTKENQQSFDDLLLIKEPKPIDEQQRKLITDELKNVTYVAKLGSSSAARVFLETLYAKTQYAPLKHIILMPDDQILSATEKLLEKL